MTDKPMTVGDLKVILKDVSDDIEIVLGEGFEPVYGDGVGLQPFYKVDPKTRAEYVDRYVLMIS